MPKSWFVSFVRQCFRTNHAYYTERDTVLEDTTFRSLREVPERSGDRDSVTFGAGKKSSSRTQLLGVGVRRRAADGMRSLRFRRRSACDSQLRDCTLDQLDALTTQRDGTMTTEDNKATFLRFVQELNKGNLGIIDEVCSPRFAFYSPSRPNGPRGLDGAREMITTALTVIPDVQSTIEDIFAEGDKIAVRWTFRGTYQGDTMPGYPKPAERFIQGAISIYRFVDGKIEQDWGVGELSHTASAWNDDAK